MKKNRFLLGAATDIGQKRAVNQDNFCARVEYIYGKQIGIFAVADGMGGLAEGEYASAVAASKINEWTDNQLTSLFSNNIFSERNCMAQLELLMKNINDAILNYALSKSIQAGIAISLLLIYKSQFFILHAGDTRVYTIRKKKTAQLTEDETWVAEQVKNGKLTPEEAAGHDKRHVLTNCLGMFENIRLQFFSGKIYSKDIFLVCSDGFYNMITPEEYFGYINADSNTQAVTEGLISLANARGGPDNITAIIVKLR